MTRTKKAFQILESLEADFVKMTWTLGLGNSDEVYAGQVAVLPSEEFMQMSARLADMEGLLRRVIDSNVPAGVGSELYEHIQRRLDPEQGSR